MDAMDETTATIKATLGLLVKMSTRDPDLLTVLVKGSYNSKHIKDLLIAAVNELGKVRSLLLDLEWVRTEKMFRSCLFCNAIEGTIHKTDCRLNNHLKETK